MDRSPSSHTVSSITLPQSTEPIFAALFDHFRHRRKDRRDTCSANGRAWNNGIAAYAPEDTVIRIGPTDGNTRIGKASSTHNQLRGDSIHSPTSPRTSLPSRSTCHATAHRNPRRRVDGSTASAIFVSPAKLFHSFTHERRPEPAEELDFKARIGPIAEADRLSTLLIQFP